MEVEAQHQLIEDVSYLRGRFDTAIPEMQRTSDKITEILEGHNKRLMVIEERQISLSSEMGGIKTKVAFFGAGAGVIGTIIINWVAKKLGIVL